MSDHEILSNHEIFSKHDIIVLTLWKSPKILKIRSNTSLKDGYHHIYTQAGHIRPWEFVENALLKRHGEKYMRPFHCAEDVKDLIENETKLTYDIKVHTAEEIQAVRESLPSLGPLARAMKIHEILITADGVIKSKFLPSDVYYDHVKIAVSRRHKRVESIGENGEDI